MGACARRACLLVVFRRSFTSAVCLLSEAERDILVLDHVLDLPLHCHEEEHKPIHEQDGPEDRHIEHREEGHRETDREGLTARIPKLEFRQPAHEWLVLLIRFRRQTRSVAVHVHLRSEEANQEIQVVDAETVGDNVEAPEQENAQEVYEYEHREADPAFLNVRRRLVEHALKLLLQLVQWLGFRWR